MQYVLTIADLAERDLGDAYRWYEEIEESLGRRFQIQVEKSIENIVENPNQFQVRYKDIRICFIDIFP